MRRKARLTSQNAINKTLVAPFSTRPALAPVSVPVTWGITDDRSPHRWTIATVAARVAAAGDALAPLIGVQQHLPAL
jgi:bifunctional non-homologous end joining protein LigD